jgi:uncharacterized membrane protein
MNYAYKGIINGLHKIYSPIFLIFIMLFLINFNFQNIIYTIIKTLFVYLFIFFLPGYLFVNLFFERELKLPEIFVFSVGASISLTILCGMIINFLGIGISIANILNFVSILALIFSLLILIKGFPHSKIKKYEGFPR